MSIRNINRDVSLGVLSLGISIALLASTGCNASPEAKEAKFLKRGDAFAANKEYARAALEFENAAKAMPKDAEPYYRMGLAYIELRDWTRAANSFRTATSIDPKHSGAQLKLAELMASTKNTKLIQEAASRIHTAFGTSPVDPEAVDALAMVDWRLGKPQEALQRLEELLKTSPSHVKSSMALAQMKLSQGDANGAEEVLKQATAAAPQSFEVALALGEFYMSLPQTAKAEPAIRKAVQLNPKSGAALTSLGRILIAENRLSEAEGIYQQIAALPEQQYKPLHAIFLYQTGRRDEALRELEKVSQADPDNRYARTLLVTVCFGMNKVSDAAQTLAAALRRNPKDTEALLQQGEMYLRLGNAAAAEKDLNDLLHFKADSPQAHFALAEVYGMKGQSQERLQELNRTIELAPNLTAARLALADGFLAGRQPQAALDAIDQAPPTQQGLLPVMIERNWALLELGDAARAKAGIEGVMKRYKEPEAYLQRSVVKLSQRDYDGAREDAEEDLKGSPGDIRAAVVIAESYASQKQLPKALERLRQIAAERPQSPQFQALSAEWYLRANDRKAARKAFEAAKSADPRFVAADIALAQLDLREGKVDAAKQRAITVLAGDHKYIPALLVLAATEQHAGDRAAAIDAYRRVLSVDSSDLIALNDLAYTLAADHPDEALKFAQQAAMKEPNNPIFEDTLGWVYYRKGMYSISAQYLKLAADKDPTPIHQFHLGMSYMKAGERDKGQKLVSAALVKEPNLAKTQQGW